MILPLCGRKKKEEKLLTTKQPQTRIHDLSNLEKKKLKEGKEEKGSRDANTRAKSRFLGLWNCSQFLSFANSVIFFFRSSRVTLSSPSGAPVISVISFLKNKQNKFGVKTKELTGNRAKHTEETKRTERQLALTSDTRTRLYSNFLGRRL